MGKSNSIWLSLGCLVGFTAFVAGMQNRVRHDVGPGVQAGSGTFTKPIASNEPTMPPVDESAYFYEMMQLLERHYVDSVQDEMKLAQGAVRGMVASLFDPDSVYMDEKEFGVFQRQLKGQYEGIGVELRMDYDDEELAKARKKLRSADPLLMVPNLVVSAVFPGGPAEMAGIKVGDRIRRVNGKWLFSTQEIRRLRQMQRDVASGQAKAEDFESIRQEFQRKAESTVAPSRAMEILTSGTGKSLDLSWEREGRSYEGQVTSARMEVPTAKIADDGTLHLRLHEGAAQALRNLGDLDKVKTIDLRQSGAGSSPEVPKVLATLGPSGDYGQILSDRSGGTMPLTVRSGRKDKAEYRLLVDKSTTGASALLAQAMAARGIATLEGELASPPVWREVVSLPQGSGYTLVTGRFTARTIAGQREGQ